MIIRLFAGIVFAISFCLCEHLVQCWVISTSITARNLVELSKYHQQKTIQTAIYFSSPADNNDEGNEKDLKRTTFDEAGKSLIDEEDYKRMEAMGDFDLNPDVSLLYFKMPFPVHLGSQSLISRSFFFAIITCSSCCLKNTSSNSIFLSLTG